MDDIGRSADLEIPRKTPENPRNGLKTYLAGKRYLKKGDAVRPGPWP